MGGLAEQKLNSTTYKGEGRRWDFERFVTIHQEQHTILECLVPMDTMELMNEAKCAT